MHGPAQTTPSSVARLKEGCEAEKEGSRGGVVTLRADCVGLGLLQPAVACPAMLISFPFTLT